VIVAALTCIVPADFLPYMVGMSISAQSARGIHYFLQTRFECSLHGIDRRFVYHGLGIVRVSILDTAWNSFPF